MSIAVEVLFLWGALILASWLCALVVPSADTTPFFIRSSSLTVLTTATIIYVALRILTNRRSPMNRRVRRERACYVSKIELKKHNGSDRVIRLTHNAEQLNAIEQTLIRKIGRSQTIDRDTDVLICQLQIATNRIISQLKDMTEETESVS